jgi:WD40 repeat protein
MSRWFACIASALVLCWGPSFAWAQAPPAAGPEPLLRLEAGGPTSRVEALTFSPDGQTLYVAGFDKVVRVWSLGKDGQFVLERAAYRVPIGPGLDGAINAIALSADGAWLAIGGSGVIRGAAGYRNPGLVLPAGALNAEQLRDQGKIYVYNTQTRALTILRAHLGPVLSLAFAPPWKGKPPLLVSTAHELDANHVEAGTLRLWDVAKGELLETAGGQPSRLTHPGLALWHTGDGRKQVRVACAWGDGKLRLWDVGSNDLWTEDDGEDHERNHNITLAHLPGPGLARLVTGSFQKWNGRLQFWNVPPGEGPQPDRHGPVLLPLRDGSFYIPRALTLLSSQADGRLDYAAVVLRGLGKGGENYSLRLLSLDPGNFGKLRAPIGLWEGGSNLPVLAAAPNGKYLAVAGDKDHAIRIYAIQDLLAYKSKPRRVLRSAGVVLPQATFVRRGTDLLGLVLSTKGGKGPGQPPQPPQAGDLLYDFTARKLAPYQKQWPFLAPVPDPWSLLTAALALNQVTWRLDTLPSDGWQATLERDAKGNILQPAVIAVRQGLQRVKQISLKKGQSVTDYVLRPPQLPLQVPILVIAYHDDNFQPTLAIYNAQTGEQVYQYTAHTHPIRCLAFSADGKLLVSTSDDQTVCIWSLNQYNLDLFLGQRGQVSGVFVKEAKGQGTGASLVVARIENDSPARGKLTVGDILEEVVDAQGVAKKPASQRDFYETLFLMKPGQNVTLRRRGQPPVQLAVAQGIGDRKPLLSLFVVRDSQTQQYEWVGWSPIGPYDSSGAKADHYIGWQFNNMNTPEGASTYAAASEYRQQYHEGILKHLVARGSLPPALKEWREEDQRKPLPRPKMTSWIDEVGPEPEKRDARGQFLVRKAPVTLKLAIDDFPLEKVDTIRWQVVGAAAGFQEFEPGFDRERSADLARVLARPGVYQIRAVLRTVQAQPQEYTQEITVRFQPPAPEIRWDRGWLQQHFGKPPADGPLPPLFVQEEQFTLKAAVQPTLPSQRVRVLLQHGDKPIEALNRLAITKDLRLQLGTDLIRLSAENEGALPGYEELETASQTLVIVYSKPGAIPPPRMLLRVVPVPSETNPQVVEPGKPVITRANKVRIQGTITANEPLHEVKREDQNVAGFEADKQKTFSLMEEVTLKQPGPHKLSFLARSKNSAPARVVVELDYRPPLPSLVLTHPSQGLVVYDEDKGPPAVAVKGRLLVPDDPYPYQVEVLVNDQPLGKPRPFTARAQELSEEFIPQPGENRIQVRLSRNQAESETSEVRVVRYLRPPNIIQFTNADRLSSQPVDKPLLDLSAQVNSLLPVDPKAAQAEVNGRTIAQDLLAVEKTRGGDRTWQVQLKEVPLDAGANEIRLWVSNAEGRSRQPGVLRLVYLPPRQRAALPQVDLLEPLQDIQVTVPEQKLRFRLHSASPLKRVTLVREGKVPIREPFDTSQLKRNAQGIFVVQSEISWQLQPGENTLRVEAANEGGAQAASVVVNYLYMPVRLEVTAVEVENQTLSWKEFSGGQEVPSAQCSLHGWVIWDQDNEEQLKQLSRIRVYVNGKRQKPGRLEPRAGNARRREFRADLLLTQAKNNRIEIELPDSAQQADNRDVFTLNCRQPQSKQTARLLIVSYAKKDKQLLKDRALRAIQAKPKPNSPDRFESPAFQDVRLYGPLAGEEATPDRLFTQLRIIKKQSDLLFPAGSTNDVTIVYYEGKEDITNEGHFFETGASVYDPDLRTSAFTCDGLERSCGDIMGAQILLLDVIRGSSSYVSLAGQDRDRVLKRPGNVHIGVLRFLVLGDQAVVVGNPQLLEDLNQATSAHDKLAEVNSFVDRLVKISPQAPTFDQVLPDSLRPLEIGKRP